MKKYIIALPLFMVLILASLNHAKAQPQAKTLMFPQNRLSIPKGLEPSLMRGNPIILPP